VTVMAMADPTNPETPLEAALRYAELGLRVLPILPATKRPPFDEWQNKATTNTDTIRLWWNNNPRYGVGIATGRYGDRCYFVLDVDTGVDPKTGRVKEGDESLADLEAEHAALPDTVESQSGSGGRHLWFWTSAEVRNDQHARLGVDLDIRGEGGQVVAAPTIHPDTGRPTRGQSDPATGSQRLPPGQGSSKPTAPSSWGPGRTARPATSTSYGPGLASMTTTAPPSTTAGPTC
jgi:hypothetical protein